MATLRTLTPFFVTTSVLFMANGVLGTIVTLRAVDEGFGSVVIGLLGGGYFTGFLIACLYAPYLIRFVGHIRVFAALTATAAILTLILINAINPIVWILARLCMGFCISGLFLVLESWINEQTDNERRGRVLSYYRLVDFTSVMASQLVIPLIGTGGFLPFSVAAILFCLALVPIALADQSKPKPPEIARFDLKAVWTISPVACTACFAIGMTNAAFRLVGPLYGREVGFGNAEVAIFISMGVAGGTLLQVPLGMLSDAVSRRAAILTATVGSIGAGLFLTFATGQSDWMIFLGAFLFGAFAFPLYSLASAHANDQAKPEEFVVLAAGLLFCFGSGAAIGPVIASLVIESFGPAAFFTYASIIHATLLAATLLRMIQRPTVEVRNRGRFQALMRTSPVLQRMARPAPDHDKAD